MKISRDPFLPIVENYSLLRVKLYDIFGQIAIQLNNVSDGLLTARLSASALPTTGSHAKGDIVYNNNPSELGAPLAKYVIVGWICTVSGTPGTWLQMRTLTGN